MRWIACLIVVGCGAKPTYIPVSPVFYDTGLGPSSASTADVPCSPETVGELGTTLFSNERLESVSLYTRDVNCVEELVGTVGIERELSVDGNEGAVVIVRDTHGYFLSWFTLEDGSQQVLP